MILEDTKTIFDSEKKSFSNFFTESKFEFPLHCEDDIIDSYNQKWFQLQKNNQKEDKKLLK
jgi:hypothetical protein